MQIEGESSQKQKIQKVNWIHRTEARTFLVNELVYCVYSQIIDFMKAEKHKCIIELTKFIVWPPAGGL